jgi:hypothetical protein
MGHEGVGSCPEDASEDGAASNSFLVATLHHSARKGDSGEYCRSIWSIWSGLNDETDRTDEIDQIDEIDIF